MSYIVDQQTILFYRCLARSSNVILHTLLCFKSGIISFSVAKCNLPRLSLPNNVTKEYMWNCFALKAMHDRHLMYIHYAV